ncbi:MAG: histidinol dehydrogenase [Candidatus Bathyarchaeia archaeon]
MRVLTAKEFEEHVLPKMLNRAKFGKSTVFREVKKIVKDVREKGDCAVIDYTRKFDCVDLNKERLRVSDEEIKNAYRMLKEEEVNALKKAAENIRIFHEEQVRHRKWSTSTLEGVRVGQIIQPLSSVGIYTPGGKAAYPTSALMCTIPAKIAGVERIVVCSPPRSRGEINPAVLVAANVGGANEIYRVGGAQAVAALAYGTETIPKVEKIVGPGNIYVTAAKLLVGMEVAVDLPAGPTELLVIADEAADPHVVACDIIAQAEHDAMALTMLLTTSKSLAYKTLKEVQQQLKGLHEQSLALKSIKTNCFLIIVEDLEKAIRYTNLIAPEHVEILTKKPRDLLWKLKNAGAVFVGNYSAVVFGDYSAGINHVLPTGGYARAFSGLSVWSFVKTINFLECDEKGYQNLKDITVTLAKLEDLDGHVKSVLVRESYK